MKSSVKSKIIILTTLGILFALVPIITTDLSFITGNSIKSSEYSDDINLDNKNLKISTVSGKIHIDNNWTATKSAGICTGDGTYSEPYVMEDLVIDGEGSGSCILIENSDVYFIITDCIVNNSGSSPNAGIRLDNVKNGKLFEDIHSYNNADGIHLIHCHNITIAGNRVENNNYGIVLGSSNNSIISENVIIDNKIDGIYFFQTCNNNTISKNTIINNNQEGIDISGSSNENMILGNIVKNNEIGIEIWSSKNNYISENNVESNNWTGILIMSSDSNNITKNKAKNNEVGINLWESKNNTVSENIIYGNSDFGCFIGEANCTNNLIYYNCFKKNQYNAYDNGLNNKWDNGTIGNYWDDYTGEDTNDDGIGDTPYYIQVSSKDNFPLMKCPFPMEVAVVAAIQGYNIFLLLGILSVVAIILSKKVKKC
jgi:parallel beta-helix repeat protein